MAVETRERVYQFICSYVDEHHMPPTRQEIADGVGMSKPSVQRAIDILEARGKMKRERFKARTVLSVR
jgi:SOS-response transcriptional repressor LexA